ncbi:MAG: phosphoribosylamine--glycine ligase, partial [Bacteroidia bacterium]|nr:phosphoribosylamine--glycine ligase [Bacteroidia bacterium]
SQLSHVKFVGPSAEGAKLEGSKDYAKQFMLRHNIPTAEYKTFSKDNFEGSYTFLDSLKSPYVLKADGLAAGKGVLIIDDLKEAKTAISEMIQKQKFGEASSSVVIEEFLDGIELSVFVITDGENYVILPEAKDYKRIGEGDTGLNTGGMGAVSPVPFANHQFLRKVEDRIVVPTVKGLQKDKIDYIGFIFIGLMKVGNDPYVIEYNVRMGDPETEVVLPRIKNDLLEIFDKACSARLDDIQIELEKRTAVTIMAVSGGYPGSYEKGRLITGLDSVENCLVFHAGTKIKENNSVTSGGRVMALTCFGDSINEAANSCYTEMSKINFEGKYFRRDIGKDLIEFEEKV